MEELRVRWIWKLWREARESGRRARVVSNAVHGEPREEKERRARRRRKVRQVVAREGVVVDLATPPTAEHAATFLDGHATASGGIGAITANRASPGETGRREGERMTCGVHM